jgi:2-hydroxy-4-carboxymuconate semialdehyde hemiacetal dehydrogenase
MCSKWMCKPISFRRTNMNALGQPRSWTDHLLWHHAAHTVDLFAYQAGSPVVKAHAIQGPIHPTLGIAMDMSIQLQAANGAICTLSLSFNNDGPLGTFFRYIGDTATYIARYDDLFNGKEEQIDVSKVAVSMNGIEVARSRIFCGHSRRPAEPNASVAQVLPSRPGSCTTWSCNSHEQARCWPIHGQPHRPRVYEYSCGLRTATHRSKMLNACC